MEIQIDIFTSHKAIQDLADCSPTNGWFIKHEIQICFSDREEANTPLILAKANDEEANYIKNGTLYLATQLKDLLRDTLD